MQSATALTNRRGFWNYEERKDLILCLSSPPCIPRTATVRYMPGRELANHRSCLRVRSVSAHGKAVWSGKIDDTLACLRGDVNGGAEEMIFFCGPVRAVAQACHSACQCECICRLSMCTYARFTRTCRQACWLFSDHLRMQSTTALTNRRGCWNCEERKEASLQPAGSFNGVQKRGAFCDPCVVAQACN